MMKGQLKRIGTIGVFSLCNKLVGLAVTQNSLSVERSGLEAIDVLVALVLHNKLPPPLWPLLHQIDKALKLITHSIKYFVQSDCSSN